MHACMIASMICALLYQNSYGGLSLKTIRVNRSAIVVWSMLLLPILLSNHDVAKGRDIYLLYYIVVIAWGILLAGKDGWDRQVWRLIRLFCVIHFAAGIFLLINKSYLLNNIVPLFQTNDSANRLLINAINSGYMTGLCYHYSTMGMYMSIGVIAFSNVLFQDERIRIWDVFIFLAFLIGLAMTGKRGPLLFAILALGIAVLVTRKKHLTQKQLQRGAVAIVILLVTFVIAYINVPQLKQIIERFAVGDSDLNDFTSGRVDYFWNNAIEMFREHPFFGHGWRSFKYIGAGTGNANDAHNIYLQLLAEVGLVGFVFVMTFMLHALVTTYKAIRKNAAKMCMSNESLCILKMAFAYQIFFLLYGITGNPLYDPQCYFPYIICCVIGYSAMNRIRRRNTV